ncbi:tRNA (guanosine(37)-N1)-methyltransferase TrmD [candidate division KSB1 bacterium]|nr:tRNA (guanosine(37)-N1)-methyltransferase TrmD [candidate division KSB1 bacterium]
MDFYIVSAFPEMVAGPLKQSILKRAQDRGLVDYHFYNLRDYGVGKHQQIDDYPYGGGPGMVLKPEPIITCIEKIIESIPAKNYKIIWLSPEGATFQQKKAIELTTCEHLILICGHYKGIDERVRIYFSPEDISIGNYILSSGEIAALVVIDSIVRLIPGVLNDLDSAFTDSFQGELLDCAHYTRPAVYRDMAVPEVLMNGNHAQIEKWRHKIAIERTIKKKNTESDGK